MTAYIVDGKLDKVMGAANSPTAAGKLCARGYGLAQSAYSPNRLEKPLKRNVHGDYEVVSWDLALSEIADQLNEIAEEEGPQAIGLIHNGNPTAQAYGTRLMAALGSANAYCDEACCDLAGASGCEQAIGFQSYEPDLENTGVTLIIGQSSNDGLSPARIAALQAAHEAGAQIVLADPRLSTASTFASEWLPVNPGTELALLLAIANQMIQRGQYDKAYVAANSEGLDEWAEAIAECDCAWAAELTGVDANDIARVAANLAEAAPAACVDVAWGSSSGSGYANAAETARAACLVNTLLGAWNQPGGAYVVSTPESFTEIEGTGTIAGAQFAFPEVEVEISGSNLYPLAATGLGSSAAALQLAHDGSISALVMLGSNPVATAPDTDYVKEALENVDLSVVFDTELTDTAAVADYVLPAANCFESTDLPICISGKEAAVAQRQQVIDCQAEEALSVDECVCALAENLGVQDWFDFTLDELAAARLESVGVDPATLQKSGTQPLDSFAAADLGSGTGEAAAIAWATPSGKIQFVSEACEEAGISPCPVWVAPAVCADPQENALQLITGDVPVNSSTQTANAAELMSIVQDYNLDRAWINTATAEEMGIEDNDCILIGNGNGVAKVNVKVTDCIAPTALFLPSNLGIASKGQKTAQGVGVPAMDFVSFGLADGYGTPISQGTMVVLMKEGA